MARSVASPEGLLEAINQYTTRVRIGDLKQFQWIYLFDELAEAQRTVQLLNALGLMARAYPNAEGSGAKLYFQFNQSTPLSEKFAHAPAYFGLLRDVSAAAARHVSDGEHYKHSLYVNTPDGKNVLFSIKIEQLTLYQPVQAPVANTAESPAPATPAAAMEARKPQIFHKKGLPQDVEAKKMSKLGEALGSKMATHTSMVVKLLGTFFAIFVVFLMMRGFLCPDFATVRSETPPWYCSVSR